MKDNLRMESNNTSGGISNLMPNVQDLKIFIHQKKFWPFAVTFLPGHVFF